MIKKNSASHAERDTIYIFFWWGEGHTVGHTLACYFLGYEIEGIEKNKLINTIFRESVLGARSKKYLCQRCPLINFVAACKLPQTHKNGQRKECDLSPLTAAHKIGRAHV